MNTLDTPRFSSPSGRPYVAMVCTLAPETNVMRGLAEGLVRAGTSLRIYADKTENVRLPGMDIHPTWTKGATFPFQIARTARRDPPDVVHVHHEFNLFGSYLTSLLFPILLLLLRARHIPVIVTLHAVVARSQVDESFRSLFVNLPVPAFLLRTWFLPFYRSVVRLADHIIVHAPILRDTLVNDYGASEHRVSVIPLGVPTELPSLVSTAHPIVKNKPPRYILTFGYIIRRKGFEDLIRGFAEIASEFPDLSLVILGSTWQQDYLDELRRSAKDLGVGPRVHFPGGYTKAQEIAEWIHGSEIVAIPAIHSIAGSSVLTSAMAFAKPVVAAHVGVLKDELADGKDTLHGNPEDPHSYAVALRQFLTRPDLRADCVTALGKKSRRRSWAMVGRETTMLYKRLFGIGRSNLRGAHEA